MFVISAVVPAPEDRGNVGDEGHGVDADREGAVTVMVPAGNGSGLHDAGAGTSGRAMPPEEDEGFVTVMVPAGDGRGQHAARAGVPPHKSGHGGSLLPRHPDSLAADAVRDAELEILAHDAAGQLEELENLHKQAGVQQARIDYLEGSNSQLCIELQAANSHHQELVTQLQQVGRERENVIPVPFLDPSCTEASAC